MSQATRKELLIHCFIREIEFYIISLKIFLMDVINDEFYVTNINSKFHSKLIPHPTTHKINVN